MNNCPITSVTADGMSTDAGSDGHYGNIHGNINDVETDLFGYISPLRQVAFRFPRVCGNDPWPLKTDHWKTISIPCKVDNTIMEIFKRQLSSNYGDDGDWVMYEQDTDYSAESSQAATSYRLMLESDHMIPGKGYWIITSLPDVTVHVSESTLNVTKTTRQLPVNHSVTSPSFTEVHTYNGMPDSTSTIQKVMLGNPFPGPIHLGNVFVSNNGGSNYYPMYDDVNTTFTNKTVYVYDKNSTDSTLYDAKTANGTPGFGDTIDAGIGFFLKLNTGQGQNKIDYPFER